uniref:Uncharacterized protein n=1 Tax=Arundo donax TaxID=35708 RepID=A0A0A8XQF6_ARUDO
MTSQRVKDHLTELEKDRWIYKKPMQDKDYLWEAIGEVQVGWAPSAAVPFLRLAGDRRRHLLSLVHER